MARRSAGSVTAARRVVVVCVVVGMTFPLSVCSNKDADATTTTTRDRDRDLDDDDGDDDEDGVGARRTRGTSETEDTQHDIICLSRARVKK